VDHLPSIKQTLSSEKKMQKKKSKTLGFWNYVLSYTSR
jgi:hypothetical protein